jgi:hypothetical protein
MMHCRRCGGRVFVDRVFSQKLHMELYCLLCGRRWMVNKETSSFGRWLDQVEFNQRKAFGISS